MKTTVFGHFNFGVPSARIKEQNVAKASGDSRRGWFVVRKFITLTCLILAIVLGMTALLFLVFMLVSIFGGLPSALSPWNLVTPFVMLGLAYLLLWVRNRMFGQAVILRRFLWEELPPLFGLVVGAVVGVVLAVLAMFILDAPEWVGGVIAFVCLMTGLFVGFRFARPVTIKDRTCVYCGYNLRGSPVIEETHIRCPECGEEFWLQWIDADLSDP
jgi:hypothetical protein